VKGLPCGSKCWRKGVLWGRIKQTKSDSTRRFGECLLKLEGWKLSLSEWSQTMTYLPICWWPLCHPRNSSFFLHKIFLFCRWSEFVALLSLSTTFFLFLQTRTLSYEVRPATRNEIIQKYSHQYSKNIPINIPKIFPPIFQKYSHQWSKNIHTNIPKIFPPIFQKYSHQYSKNISTNITKIFPPPPSHN